MYKKYKVPGMDEPFDVEDIHVEQFLAKFPDAELIEDEVTIEPIEPSMEPIEPPTEPITASTDVTAYGATGAPEMNELSTIDTITDDAGNITGAKFRYQEENAAGDGPVTIEEEMPLEEAALTQTGLNNYVEFINAAQSAVGATPLGGAIGFVVPKVARVIRSTAGIINRATEAFPKMMMTTLADVMMDNEDIDDEAEREALSQTVDTMYDAIAGIPIAGKAFRMGQLAGDIVEGVTPFADDLPEGEDFISLAQEGKYAEATDDFLNQVAEGVPSLLAAMYGGIIAWGGLGAGQAGQKFEEGFEDLEGKVEGGIPARLYGAATASGLTEFTLNKLISGQLGKYATKIADAISPQAAGQFLKSTIAGLSGGSIEFAEEGFADTLDRGIDKYLLGKDRGGLSDWLRGFLKNGAVGFGIGAPVSSYAYKFNKQSNTTKDLIANKIQPNKLNDAQEKKEKILFKAGTELNQLQNDPELYKAKTQEIIDAQNSLRESRDAVNNQISELSPDQFERLNNISNEITGLQEYLNPNFNSELEVDTAESKIKELEQEQENIFLNPQGIDKQRPEPILPENIKLSEETQNIYGVDPDVNAEKVKVTPQQIDKIINKQLGLINNVAIKTVGNFGKEGDVAEMVSQLKYAKGGMADLIKQYNPSLGVPLSAYLANPRTGLPQRAKRIVKNVTKQDVSLDDQLSQPETLTQQAFDTDFDVKVGSKLLADRIGLPTKTINEVNDIVDRSLVNVESKLKQEGLTPKQRINIADKAFAKPFIDRISKDIKNTLGKGDKFDKFVDKNWKPIAEAVIATNKVTKSGGPTKAWSQFFPNKEQVVNYFTGKDLVVGDISPKTGKALTKDQIARAVSDRKNVALAKALATQIGIEARNELFAKKPKLREQFNEDNKLQYKAKKQEAFEKIAKDIDNKLTEPTDIDKANRRTGSWLSNLVDRGIDFITGKTVLRSKRKGDRFLDKKAADKFYKASTNIVSKLPPIVREILGGYQIFGLEHFRYIPTAAKIQKDKKILIDEATNEIKTIKKGEPDFYTKQFNNLLEDTKNNTWEQLLKDKKISKEIYNLGKSIKWDKVQPQNWKIGPGAHTRKGTFAYDAHQILKKDYPSREAKKKDIDAVYNKHKDSFVENLKVFKLMAHTMRHAYKNGEIPADYVSDVLQAQTELVGGFRALTDLDGLEILAEAQDSKTFKGEHLKINVDTMSDLAKWILSPNSTNKQLDEMASQHSQIFATPAKLDIVDKILSRVSRLAGNLRITKSNKQLAKDVYLVKEKMDLYPYEVEQLMKEKNLTPEEAAAVRDILLQDPTQVLLDQTVTKEYKNIKPPVLNEAEVTQGFLDVLVGNWNKDGKVRLEGVTDKQAMQDILTKEYGYNNVAAKANVDNNFGFLLGNQLFVNLDAKDGVKTVIHEAGHLWNGIVKTGAPTLWKDIINKVKDTPIWNDYVKEIEKNKSVYAKELESYENGSDTFGLENEVFARILENYGGKKVKASSGVLKNIKSAINKFFNKLKLMLGFDPTTKKFEDLTVDEIVNLAVSEVITGNPLAHFSQLKDSKSKSWFVKSHAQASPSFKAMINPEYQGLKALKDIYKDTKDLNKAIEDSYEVVKDLFTPADWADFVSQTVKEVQPSPTLADKILVVATENSAANIKDRQAKLKLLKETGNYKESDNFISQAELDDKLRDIDNKIIDEQKQKAEGLNKNLRKILNNKSGFGKKPSKWFVPPNAEDFKGLLYALLPGGKAGVEAKKFFKTTLIDPYHKGVSASETEILQKTEKYAEISKGINFNKKIEGTPYTLGDAIKVRNWIDEGIDVDINKQEYIDALLNEVNNNVDYESFADIIKKDFPIDYNSEWRNDSFNKSIYQTINSGSRTRNLEVFANNVDAIFDKDNLQEIENLYGKKFRQVLQNQLKRMKTGRNRVSTDSQSNSFLTWINRAVATTMFVNTRSAALQLLSSLNYIGKPNNNIFQATAALGPGWRKDFSKLWNSPYLKNRRQGAKFDVLADEIAEKGEKGLNKLLKAGFLPTRYADSFAIAMGGTAYYRNTRDALIKEGMDPKEAEKAAEKSWIAATEESQQSADPAMISEIQSSNVGKLIYAFANTPFQYIRKSKRHLQDIVSGRSAAEGGGNQIRKDLQSVLYYTVGQAMMFNALQSALFAAWWEDDEEKKKALLSDKETLIIDRALTSYLKSMGNPGAVVGSLYSVISEASEQIEKKGRIDNAYKVALEATSISPPLNAKLRDLVAIGNIYKYNYKEIKENPLNPSVNNPTFEIAGNAASFVGVPLDRVIRKAQNISAAVNEESEMWQKVFQVLGWNKWDFHSPTYQAQQRKAQKEKNKYMPSSLERIQKYNQMSPEEKKAYTQKRIKEGKPLFKKEGGVKILGKAHKDGTIEIAPGLSPEKRKQVVAHENKHKQDMQSGKLDYSKDWIRWGNQHFKRTPDKRVVYKGKKYIEGHPKLPWEAAANKAESRVS